MAIKLLVTGQAFDAEALRTFGDKGYHVETCTEYLDEMGLIRALEDKDAYIAGNLEFASERVLSNSQKLKVISVFGVGYQRWVDVQAATKRGIAVTNAPGANSQAV